MSPDRRAPWWYSGDDEQPPPAEVPHADLAPEPVAPEEPAAGEPDAADGAPSMDWMALVAGAARMVDWATERVMAPHAEHADPAEHPDCMVCRTITLVGDPIGLMTTGQRPAQDPGTETAADDLDAPEPDAPDFDAPGPAAIARPGAEPIRWIPIVESHD